SDHFFFPVGVDMVQQDWAPAAALLALPFQVLGPLVAMNLEVLLAFALCGFSTYLLALHVCRHPLYAWMAGAMFAFLSFRLAWTSVGYINQANQQFLPLYLLALLRFREAPGAGRAALGGLWFFLSVMCTSYHLVYLVLLTLGTFAWDVAHAAARGPD